MYKVVHPWFAETLTANILLWWLEWSLWYSVMNICLLQSGFIILFLWIHLIFHLRNKENMYFLNVPVGFYLYYFIPFASFIFLILHSTSYWTNCTFYSITFIWQLLLATLQIFFHVKVEIILIISKYEVLIWFRQPNRQVDASVNGSVIIIQYNLIYWSTERFKLDEDAPDIK